MSASGHTRRATARTCCPSCGKREIATGDISYRRRQITYFPIARTHGWALRARAYGSHLPLAVLDERPGRQPCRQRHHGCRNHKWDVRPHHKITVHTKSTRRRSLVVVYLSRNAPFKKQSRKILMARHVVKVCDRRSALLFLHGGQDFREIVATCGLVQLQGFICWIEIPAIYQIYRNACRV